MCEAFEAACSAEVVEAVTEDVVGIAKRFTEREDTAGLEHATQLGKRARPVRYLT